MRYKLAFYEFIRDWLNKKSYFFVGPLPKEKSMALYMNRSCQIGWLLVRLLPYIQPEENAFGDQWKQRQKILDDSFPIMQLGLNKIGKKIGHVFVKFVKEKFKFKEPFFYSEADGKG